MIVCFYVYLKLYLIIKHKFSTFFENVVSWCIFPNMQAEIFIPDHIVCCVRLESELYMVGSLVAEFPEMRLTLTWISSFYLVLTKDVPQHTATLQHKQGEGLGPWNSSKQQCVSMREDTIHQHGVKWTKWIQGVSSPQDWIRGIAVISTKNTHGIPRHSTV